MGISGDDDLGSDISLELERELFGMNDDSPAPRASSNAPAQHDDGPGNMLESELLAVLGGLGAASLAKAPSADQSNGAAARRDAVPGPDEEDAASTEIQTDAELEALFADVVERAIPQDEHDEIEHHGHDPLTIGEPTQIGEAAVTSYEAIHEAVNEQDVEVGKFLAVAPGDDMAAEASADAYAQEAEIPAFVTRRGGAAMDAEPVASAAQASADPIVDAFADLGDLDLPNYIGTAAGTRAAMAAADDAHTREQVEAALEEGMAEFEIAQVAAAEMTHEEEASVAYDEDAGSQRTLESLAQRSGTEMESAVSDASPVDDFVEDVAFYEEAPAYGEEIALSEEDLTRGQDHFASQDGYEPDAAPRLDLKELTSAGGWDATAPDDGQGEAATYVPDVQTIEIGERIEATASIDVPDIVEDYQTVVQPGDDFEAEFAESLARYSSYTPAQPAAEAAQPIDIDSEFEELFNQEFGQGDPTPSGDIAGIGTAAAGVALGAAAAASSRSVASNERDDNFASDLDRPIGIPDAAVRRGAGRKGFLIAATLGAIALAGVAYAVGNSYLGGEAEQTASAPVIKADPEPVKVQPEPTSGAKKPDQDTAIFDRVEGAATEKTAQETLITTAEEPVELPQPDLPQITQAPSDTEPEADEVLAPAEQVASGAENSVETAAAKSEERITSADTQEASPADAQTALISPKRVKTMVVRSDGTLVAAPEAPAPALAPATEAPSGSESGATAETVLSPSATLAPQDSTTAPAEATGEPAPGVAVPTPRPELSSDRTASAEAVAPAQISQPAQQPSAQAPAEQPAPVKTASAEPETAAPARTVRTQTIRPAQPAAPATDVPVPGERAADQPVTVVGRTRAQTDAPAEQVARAEPAAATETAPAPAAAGDAYAVQLASLPSVEEAQKSFANLSSRYGNLIGGRAVNIQKADIPGKGTFYRIRVTAASKDEAAKLCARIKANGGSCFISR